MSVKRLAWLLLASASIAGAFDSRDARGLDVTIEGLPEPVAVDGVMFEIQVATGTDVPQLARRVEQRWQQQGSMVQRLQQRGWQLLTRWVEGRTELVQWRGEGGAAQLIFSRLDTLRRPLRRARTSLRLPSGCAWGRLIEDRSHALRTAFCSLGLPDLLRQLRTSLLAQGWSIRHETAGLFEIEREGASARITLAAGAQRDESTLVWAGISAASREPAP
jgi:hypothetical protein